MHVTVFSRPTVSRFARHVFTIRGSISSREQMAARTLKCDPHIHGRSPCSTPLDPPFGGSFRPESARKKHCVLETRVHAGAAGSSWMNCSPKLSAHFVLLRRIDENCPHNSPHPRNGQNHRLYRLMTTSLAFETGCSKGHFRRQRNVMPPAHFPPSFPSLRPFRLFPPRRPPITDAFRRISRYSRAQLARNCDPHPSSSTAAPE